MNKTRSIGNYILQRMTFKRLVILIILALFAIPFLKGVFSNSNEEYINEKYSYKFVKGDNLSENKILAVSVQGLILTESSEVPNPFDVLNSEGITYGYEVKEKLIRAVDDNSIKGILLQVNSPGGTIAGSKAVADGIKYYKEQTGNPVYAHIRDVGASGAYWAAAASDNIIVDSGSMVGSIGVIMGPFTYYENVLEEGSILGNVVTDGGISHTYFSSGQYKDIGSPYRELTDEERAHWQESLDNEYEIFVDHVSKNRKIPKETIVNTIKHSHMRTKGQKNLN